MKRTAKFTMPYPPTVNTYWARSKYGVILTKKGRDYRETAIQVIEAQKVETFIHPVHISINLYPPDNRKRDLDNTLKAMFDAIQHAGVVIDDNQFKQLFAAMWEKDGQPRADIEIEELR